MRCKDSGSYRVCAGRGGGERGFTGRGIATAFAASAAGTTEAGANADIRCGSTKATAVTSGFSASWQHDIEQSIISPMSCPHSISECGGACFFW